MKTMKGIRLDNQMIKQLEIEGAKMGLDFSGYVRTIIYAHMYNLKSKNTMN
jgi:hypothetical protein